MSVPSPLLAAVAPEKQRVDPKKTASAREDASHRGDVCEGRSCSRVWRQFSRKCHHGTGRCDCKQAIPIRSLVSQLVSGRIRLLQGNVALLLKAAPPPNPPKQEQKNTELLTFHFNALAVHPKSASFILKSPLTSSHGPQTSHWEMKLKWHHQEV